MKIWEFLELHGSSIWTKGAFARDSTGIQTQVLSPEAVAWCSIGLLMKFARMSRCEDFRAAAGIAYRETTSYWNDDSKRMFEDVLAAFKKADL